MSALSGSQKSVPDDVFNAFGQKNSVNSQGVANRNQVEAALPGVTTQASQIGNAGSSSTANLAQDTINGNYLNGSPALWNQYNNILNQAGRQSADSNKNIQSQFNRAGMNFSTANQQAQQANTAANLSNATSTAANLLGSNYQAERAYQNNAPSLFSNAQNLLFQPYQSETAINSAANGTNQLAAPTLIQQPGPLDVFGQLAGTGLSAATLAGSVGAFA